MITLIVILICLLILFAISMRNAEFVFVPHIGFVAGFLLQVLFCFFYVSEWKIDLSITTALTIILGCTTFVTVSLFFKKIQFKARYIGIQDYSRENIYETYTSYEQQKTPISSLILIIFVVLQLVALVGYIYFMLNNMEGSGIAAKIYYYRQQTADYGEEIPIPRVLSFLRLLSGAIGYVCSFFLAKNYIEKIHGKSILLITNVFISFGVEGILGARGGMFNFLVAIITEFMLVRYQYTRKKPRFKSLVKLTIIGLAILFIFFLVGVIIGRPDTGPISEMAIYIGAPLKNLDILISDNINNPNYHASTFYSLLSDINGLFSNIDLKYNSLPSRWNYIQGHSLGNVYTTFSNFWYDLRIFGVILYSALMALISQSLFKKAISTKHKQESKSAFAIVIYAYFFSSVMFSFFANRFYSQFFSLFTIKFFIAVYTIIWIIQHFRFRLKLLSNELRVLK